MALYLNRYTATIAWAYKYAPSTGGDDADRVTAYLAGQRHWDALEEHLRALNEKRP